MIRNSHTTVKRLGLHDSYSLRGSRCTVMQAIAHNGLQLLWRREADWKLNPQDLLGSFDEEVHQLLDDFIFASEELLHQRRELTYQAKRLALMSPRDHPAYQIAAAEVHGDMGEVTPPQGDDMDELFEQVEANNKGVPFSLDKPDPRPAHEFEPAWPLPEPEQPDGWGQW